MKGILLFGHGARNPAWRIPFETIRQKIQGTNANVLVELGLLGLLAPSFEEGRSSLAGQGATHITVVPVFIAGGGHVLIDLPNLIASILQRFAGLTIHVASPVGESDAVLDAMARYAVNSAG